MEEFRLADYISIVKRRKSYLFAVALVIFILSVLFALHYSNYRSTVTVEVAPADISSSTTIPAGMSAGEYNESLADLRISHLQQKVMSTSSLVEIITKFNLYQGARKYSPIADVAEGMFKKIKLELVSGALANASTAQKASVGDLSAIAFTLSFDYSDPLVAQQVTNELVSRFLDEDLKDRRNEAHKTAEFLGTEIKALEASMDDQEKKIAEFRAANGGLQPESLAFNQQAAESTMLSIQNIDAQITANQGTLGTLRAQLATVDPYTRVVADGQVLTTPAIQLKALKAQYATLSAQYGPDHPDVIKLSHQIASLQKQVGGSTSVDTADSAEIREKITDTQTNLAAAKKTYGDDHPDVVALQHKLAKLQSELKNAQSHSMTGIKADADNPAYLQLVAELQSAQEQHDSLVAEKTSLLAQQQKYQEGISKNPEAEQKLAALTRDYENSQLRYRELKEKKMSADMNETIEQDRSGQRLVIINPPEVPQQTQPARKLFVLGGLALAFFAGLASVVAAQIISQSIVGPAHLEYLVGVGPLVTIPHLTTQAERNSAGRRRLKTLGLALGVFVIAALIFSYTVEPLDVLWSDITHRLGIS